MSSSFYPATLYHQQDQKRMIYELDKEEELSSKLKEIRKKIKEIEKRLYAQSISFDELKKLQVTERFNPKTGEQVYPTRFPKGKGNFKLHSFQQEIELIQGLNFSTGKNIGIYPEIKEPAFHKNEGKNLTEIVLKTLSDYGYKTKKDNCILQCFDAKELERIRKELKSELFLVQLIEFPEETKKNRINDKVLT